MKRRTHTTSEGMIVELTRLVFKALKKLVFMASEITKRTKVSVRGVYHLLRKWKEAGTAADKRPAGRPPAIAAVGASVGADISTTTIRRRLCAAGVEGRVATKKHIYPNWTNKRDGSGRRSTGSGRLMTGCASYGRMSRSF